MKAILVFMLLVGAVFCHTQQSQITIKGQARKDCLRMNYDPDGYNSGSGIYEQWPIMLTGSAVNYPNGILSDNYTCGFMPWGNQAASAQCEVDAGEEISITFFHGANVPGDSMELDYCIAHGHVGPIMISMAKMPASKSHKGVKWFKIWQQGMTKYNGISGADNEWASANLLNKQNCEIKFNIPGDLAPGNYFIRSELIALHGASERNGAQPYVRCGELVVKGSGTVDPSNEYGMEIPSDAYATLDHPGILYNPWWDPKYPYPFPGGDKVYTGGAAPPTPTPNTPTPTPTPPTPTPTPGGDDIDPDTTPLTSGSWIKPWIALWDQSRQYLAMLGDDGNFAIYKSEGGSLTAVWASGSAGIKANYMLNLRVSGNMVIYNTDTKVPVWASNTRGKGTSPYQLVMQSNGELVWYDSQKTVIWKSSVTVGDVGSVGNPNPFNNKTSSSVVVGDDVEPFDENLVSSGSFVTVALAVIVGFIALL